MSTECERDVAARFGATAHDDPYRGANHYYYSLCGWYVWLCSQGWAKARLLKGHYTQHSYHATLAEALAEASKK